MHFLSRRTMNWAVVATLAISAVSRAATLHVPGDYPTIQACIDAATSGVDECVVAPGTHHETINFLGKAITLRSSDGADVTTIDATGIGGSVVTCASGEGPNTVLDGFTITGGNGTDVEGQTHGGGMYNNGGSPTVTNCTFTGNQSYAGGGMHNFYYSSPTVTNCTFSGNTADIGGGLDNKNHSSPIVTSCSFSRNTADVGGGMLNFYYSSPMVTNCTFGGNMANFGIGGGMYNDQNSSPAVTNCIFSGNQSNAGGGMYNAYSRPTVIDCTFSENTAETGGGMHNYFSNTIVTNSNFSSNTASGAGYGGGMHNGRSSPTVIKCTFSGNTANFGGGMYNYGYSSPTVKNCAFSGNTTPYNGGGMYNSDYSSPAVINCTFSRNSADYNGGGMYNYRNSPRVINCILWGDAPNEIYNFDALSSPIVSHSDVMVGYPGAGNINADPMFVRLPNPGPDGMWDGVDDDYGDLRLQPGSPCINWGDPAFVAQPGETDLDGHARVLCGRVDMGAYEFGIGDYDCDLIVDLIDFANWSACMTAPTGTELRISNSEERMTNMFDLLSVAPPQISNWKSAIGNLQSSIDNRQSAIDNPCAAFDFDGDGDVDLRDFAGFELVMTPP